MSPWLITVPCVPDTTNFSSQRNKPPKEFSPRNQQDWRRSRSGRNIRQNFPNIKTIKSYQSSPWRKFAWLRFPTCDQPASIGLIFWGGQWQWLSWVGNLCNSLIISDLRNCPSWWWKNHKDLKCRHTRRDDSQASLANLASQSSRVSRQPPEVFPARQTTSTKWSTSTRSQSRLTVWRSSCSAETKVLVASSLSSLHQYQRVYMQT